MSSMKVLQETIAERNAKIKQLIVCLIDVSTTLKIIRGALQLSAVGNREDIVGNLNATIENIAPFLPKDEVPAEMKDVDLLDRYSRWLEKRGYLDSDWYTEGNAIEDFLAEQEERH